MTTKPGNMPDSTSPADKGKGSQDLHKATQFDGDPQPGQADVSPTGLKPRDDTPATLEKREGPRNP